MAKKNAFLWKLQAEKQLEVESVGETMKAWTEQATLDAIILTLGYGDNMKPTWSKARILAFVQEFLKNYRLVCSGISRAQDADANRDKVDKLLKNKVAANIFVPWEMRYRHWEALTLKEEVAENRGLWKRSGFLQKDHVTSELLKGVGKDGE